MKKSHIGKNPFIGVTCACFIISGVFSVLAFLEQDSGIQTTQDNQIAPPIEHKASLTSKAFEQYKTSPIGISASVQNSLNPSAVDDVVPTQDYADLMSEGVQEQFRQVAAHYENNMRFPAYSKPFS